METITQERSVDVDEPAVIEASSKMMQMAGVTYAGETPVPVEAPPAEFRPFPTMP